MFEMTVDLVETRCSDLHCDLPLAFSNEQVGYVNPKTGKMLVWHLACAPVELQAAEMARD